MMDKAYTHGLQRLLDFCNRLDRDEIPKTLMHTARDTIMVSFATVGSRIEVYFSPDDTHYSVFRGHEDVEDDFEALERMIVEFLAD